MRTVLAVMLTLLTCTLSAEQVAIRDGVTGRAVGNASIAGIVTTAEAVPRPLRRVRVEVTATVVAAGRSAAIHSAVTDDAGHFVIDGLAEGEYTVTADKGGYLRRTWGSTRHDRPGTPVTLRANERRSDVNMTLVRGAVIAGTVLDETGGPAAGVQVRVMKYQNQAGERGLVAASSSGSPVVDRTDDLGSYRVYGLPAGEYVVAAAPLLPGVGGGNAEVRPMTDAEIRAALAARAGPTTRPGQPMTSPETLRGDLPGTIGYSPVYFPGTLSAASASAITLSSGEEFTHADFQLQVVRTARIDGVVSTTSAYPARNVQLMLMPSAQGPRVGLSGTLARQSHVAADGSFSFTGIAPGQYTLSARTGTGSTFVHRDADVVVFFGREEGPATFDGTSPSSEPLWGVTEVFVDGQHLQDVVVALQPTLTVKGRIEFEGSAGAATPTPANARVALQAVPTPGGFTVVTQSHAVGDDGSFTIPGVVPGRYRLGVEWAVTQGVAPWELAGATMSGQDVLDLPFDVGPGESLEATLTLTGRMQTVSGTLQDARGRPAPHYTILVFAADPRHWMTMSRRIRTARVGTDGRFTVAGLPAGDYLIAPLTEVAPEDTDDPAFLKSLQAVALPFTLAAGEQRVQHFRIGR